MLTVSALLTSYKSVGDHTEFEVQITCNGGLWLISRRFSDFDQLHSLLVRRFGDLIEAQLPEKQWFGRFDPNFLAKRQAGLQKYLDLLLQVPGILEDHSLLHFLEVEKHVDLHVDMFDGTNGSGRMSGVASKSVILSENDRLTAIVENAAQAFIDISEVPEPLEAEQAVQRKNEIVNVSHNLLQEQSLADHFKTQLKVMQLPTPSEARATSETIIERLENGHSDGLTYQQERDQLAGILERVESSLRMEIVPTATDLLAVMDVSVTPAINSNNSNDLGRSSLDEGSFSSNGNALSTSIG